MAHLPILSPFVRPISAIATRPTHILMSAGFFSPPCENDSICDLFLSHWFLNSYLRAGNSISYENRSAIGLRSSVGIARATGEHESEEPECVKSSFSSLVCCSLTPRPLARKHISVFVPLCVPALSHYDGANFLPTLDGSEAPMNPIGIASRKNAFKFHYCTHL